MDSKKLHANETQNSGASCQADPTASPFQPRKKMSNKMHYKKRVSRKSETLKSKDKKPCSDNSRTKSVGRKKRTRISDLFDDVETEASVRERAQQLLERLETNDPHFIKCMLPSNVAHGFWLHLPKSFCDNHLPHEDSSVVLMDEWGNEYTMNYLLGRHGFSAGWRGFSISHRLQKGDVLLFRLVDPCKFKVYIVRVNSPDVIDAAHCLMEMSASRRRSDVSQKKNKRKRKGPQYVEPFLVDDTTQLDNNPVGENASNSTIEAAAATSSSKQADCYEGRRKLKVKVNGKALCLGETAFLRDHSRDGITCS